MSQAARKIESPDAWQVDPQWQGRTAVIIASGPSLSVSQISETWISRNRDRCRVIAVNDNFKIAPWADIVYACDFKFFAWNKNFLEYFDGLVVTADIGAAQKFGAKYLPTEYAEGLSRDPSRTHAGGNSGYQAVNLAVHLGAVRILLIGFDHRYPNNKWHWFGDHPEGSRSWFDNWIVRHWPGAARDLDDLGVEVVNCTPDSALTVFKFGKLKDYL